MRRTVYTVVRAFMHAPVEHKIVVGVVTAAGWAVSEYVFKAHELSRVMEMLVGAPTFHRMYEAICERVEAAEKEGRNDVRRLGEAVGEAEGAAARMMVSGTEPEGAASDPFER